MTAPDPDGFKLRRVEPDPRDERIAGLEAQLSAATTLSDDVAEAAVAAIDYSKRLDAALAEVARLEALIVEASYQDPDAQGRLLAEALHIRSRA